MLGNHTSHIPGVLSLAPSAARGQRLPYLRHALWLWLPLAFAVTTALMVGHWVTLPKPEVGDVQLAAAIAALRDAGAPRGWFAAHVLYAALLRVGDSTAMLGHELVIEIVDDGRGVAVHGEPGAGTRVSFRFPQMAAAPPVLGAQHAA